jgi:proteasome lid subunit RPN8/RPN11
MFGVYSVSYVSISGQIMEKVVNEAREHPDEQVVGVLLGGQSGGAIVIEDAATGAAESNSTHATLTGDSIARIADDIINKRIRGSIVGWYHSHVRGGVFMSETDVETQLKLQQFSPLVTAMVIDAHTGKAGFFRADPKTKGAVLVPQENVGAEVALAVPPPYPTEQAMYPQAPPPAAPLPISTRTIVLVVVLITLAVTAGIVALAYVRGPAIYAGNLSIKHTSPKPPFTIAHPITFDANVTGSDLKNVTLAYRVLEQSPTGRGFIVGDSVTVPMLLKAAGKDTYSYTLPSAEVSGVYINYYITAFDGSGNAARSDVYTLDVGDFAWDLDKTAEMIFTRTIPRIIQIPLVTINAFSRAVTIKVLGPVPLGVLIAPVNPQVVPPNPAQLQVTSTDNANLVARTEVEVDAVYSPPGVSAVQIVRKVTLVLTVTDFILDVFSPSPPSVKPDKEINYTMRMKIYDGFTAPNAFQTVITGLPSGATWKLIQTDYRISSEQMTEISYALDIKIQSGTKAQLYLFEVVVSAATSGGTISHDVSNIQLQVT